MGDGVISQENIVYKMYAYIIYRENKVGHHISDAQHSN